MRRQDKKEIIREANERLEEKAIGFKTAGDNRDKDSSSSRVKLGFKPTKDVEEKVITIMKKLKNLSERGETGEKESAKKKLEDLSKKYGISVSSLDSKGSTLGYKQTKDDKETLKDIEKEILKLENIIRIKELI